MTRAIPELAHPLQTSAPHQCFHAIPHHTNASTSILVNSKPHGRVGGRGLWAPHQMEDVCPPTSDLTCNRPNTRRIFSGIGFPTWNPPAPEPRPYH
ncbi:hypothetical protein AVEN_111432-1 [Araneus ventricosus]|uniref:Uncharacterized protein n=1 Tax=Araneus ventricosus TaxID=182803 RepID=A0A4Y2USX8_ARAVE|nr:hypothetical protein AVEN_111432-1 [Araneus ventricosus]